MLPLFLVLFVTALLLKRKTDSMEDASHWNGWVWPVPIWNGRVPVISDGFQKVATPTHRKHLGVDVVFRKLSSDPAGLPFSSPAFTSQDPPPPILAAFDGTIWEAGMSPRGFQILIDHGSVPNLGGVTTWYQHLSYLERTWKKGDKVKAGDVLGTMGHDISTDAYKLNHLHFQLAFPRSGTPSEDWIVDPSVYMSHWQKLPKPPQHLPVGKAP